MDYVNLAVAALNEVSASTWIQWAQGSAVLGAVLVTAVLTWVVRDLWQRVDWLWNDQSTDGLEERVSRLEGNLVQVATNQQGLADVVSKHSAMLAHMQRMRDAKAAKKAKKVA